MTPTEPTAMLSIGDHHCRDFFDGAVYLEPLILETLDLNEAKSLVT